LADFKRNLILERTQVGLAVARAATGGRPPKLTGYDTEVDKGNARQSRHRRIDASIHVATCKLAPGDVVTVTRIDRLARSTFDVFESSFSPVMLLMPLLGEAATTS
jgi:DNA invertase Pin-like site-specific DNA recombinase